MSFFFKDFTICQNLIYTHITVQNVKLFNKIILSLVIVSSIYAIFLIVSDLAIVYTSLINFKLEFLPVIFILISISWFVLFLQWHLLLKNSGIFIPIRTSFSIYVSSFALGLIPGKMGDFIKAKILKDKFSVPISQTSGIIISEWFYTAIGLITLSMIGIFVFELGAYIGIVFGLLLVMLFALTKSDKLLDKIVRFSSKIKFASNFAKSLSDSFETVKNSTKAKIGVQASCLSITYWLIEACTVYLIMTALNVPEIKILEIIPMYSSAIILGFISFLPLGMGVVEGSFSGFLNYYGLNLSIAITTVIIIRLFTRFYPVLIGFIALKKNMSSIIEN
ncbi:MAG: flippase-like domain-containing protein [Nitrosarchaeum sp.]|nr:flippase-like domain-containing protein [Nitrosarchaeum sp.]